MKDVEVDSSNIEALKESSNLGGLLALNRVFRAKHMYAGTVEPHVIAQRRAANKRAKASRKRNRAR